MIKTYIMSVKALSDEKIFKAACEKLDTGRLEKVKKAQRAEDKILRAGAGLLLQYAVQKSPVFDCKETVVQGGGKLCCDEVTVDEVMKGIREPIEFRFTYGLHGKPYLKDNPSDSMGDLFFSLSHSGDYVLCVLSPKEVGADIQRIPEEEGKKTKREESIAERFFTKQERTWYLNGQEEERRERFYRIWAGKEAYMKWTGNGLTEGLSSFEVNLVEESVNNREALLWELEVPRGYVAAICKKN